MREDASWIPLLQCYVERFTYDFVLHSAEIWMPDGSCTDMAGAIKWASGFDERVTTIITWSGGKLDTNYTREPGGEWQAH